MPVIPNIVERTYMLRLNRGVPPMLDLFGGMSLEAAMVGLELGVFEALADDAATSRQVATRIDADEEGIDVLLAFLARSGYLTVQNGIYALTPMTETWMLESSDESYARYFRFWRDVLYPFWREHAVEAIQAGEPPVSVYEWLDDHPERWPIAQDAFELTAELLGDDIVEKLAIPDGGTLLDVGGGHALYSIAACDRYASLTATVFDDPAVRQIAEENIAAAGLDSRIEFHAGDYETGSFDGTYDVVLVFNVVHGNGREMNRRLFRKIAEVVAPAGQVAILDQFGDKSRVSIANTGTRFLNLTYFVSLGGRTYHTDTVDDWLADVGFRRTARHDFQDRNMSLLTAERL